MRAFTQRTWISLSVAASLLFLLLAGCDSSHGVNRPLTEQELRGQRTFRMVCAGCHRADSTVPLAGPGLQDLMRKQYLPSGAPANDERLHDLLQHGRRNMPAYGNILSPQQMDDVIAYLHTL